MFRSVQSFSLAATLCLGALPAAAQVACGGGFNAFKSALEQEAIAEGADPAVARRFFDGVQQDPRTLRADQAQGVFQLPFLDFSRRVISRSRLDRGAANLKTHRATFDKVRETYGVQPGVLLAFWALETDYGAVQGDFNTVNSLVTLAHDCRRPDLFRPQVLAAVELYSKGGLDPDTTTGAWAGEIGMVQMLPADILESGVDADGDGVVSLKTSVPDALMSGGAMLQSLGWRANEPWLQEISVPSSLDWSETGLTTTKTVADWAALGVTARSGAFGDPTLQASVLLPQGRLGPAFLAYPNFSVYFEWNQSFVYVATAAYMATRLSGSPVYNAGEPATGLDNDQMLRLQTRLTELGHDVGGIDGILGARTRAAVQAEQQRLGLPADAWPTPDLLSRL